MKLTEEKKIKWRKKRCKYFTLNQFRINAFIQFLFLSFLLFVNDYQLLNNFISIIK